MAGNDFALLHGPYSLSVDEVSLEPSSCWNLAMPGSRGVQALHWYLAHCNLPAPEFDLTFRRYKVKGHEPRVHSGQTC